MKNPEPKNPKPLNPAPPGAGAAPTAAQTATWSWTSQGDAQHHQGLGVLDAALRGAQDCNLVLYNTEGTGNPTNAIFNSATSRQGRGYCTLAVSSAGGGFVYIVDAYENVVWARPQFFGTPPKPAPPPPVPAVPPLSSGVLIAGQNLAQVTSLGHACATCRALGGGATRHLLHWPAATSVPTRCSGSAWRAAEGAGQGLHHNSSKSRCVSGQRIVRLCMGAGRATLLAGWGCLLHSATGW